jgi:hypothetical protein
MVNKKIKSKLIVPIFQRDSIWADGRTTDIKQIDNSFAQAALADVSDKRLKQTHRQHQLPGPKNT